MASSYSGSDRKDGRLLRTVGLFSKLLPHFVRTRTEATDVYDDSFDISRADRWLKAQDAGEYTGMGLMHLFIAAYVRTVAAHPDMNRFVMGGNLYAKNEIEVAIPITRGYGYDKENSVIKVAFETSDTVYDVYRRISSAISEDENNVGGNDTDVLGRRFAKAPRILRRLYSLIIRILDYFDLLPVRLRSASPFHASMMLNDLSALGIGPAAHHLFNTGTLPLVISVGSRRTAYEFDGKDSVIGRRYVDAKFSFDSRISNAEGFAAAFKTFKKHIESPNLMEMPPEIAIDDVR